MDPQPPSWSGLRRDLLLNIANRLDSDIDRLCFRAVCHNWQSVLPQPSRRAPSPSEYIRLPFPIAPNSKLNPGRRGYFRLVHSTIYCLQPLKKITDTCKTTKCWIIKVEETRVTGEVQLKDPLSRSASSEALSPRLPNGLNLLDHRVSEITKVYDLQFVAYKSNIPVAESSEILCVRPMKVAVCSKGPDFAVMAIHSCGQLSFWKNGDENWTWLSNGRSGSCYNDVVCHNGKFYALDKSGLTISVNLSKKIARVTPPLAMSLSPGGGSFKMRLLSYLGDLFVLEREEFDPEHWSLMGENSDSDEDVLPIYFHVQKLKEDERKWVPVESLGNRAMFVGRDCTFCVSAQEGDVCKKNCIYFWERFGSRDVALFDMEAWSAKTLSRVPGCSALFWPPPSWLV